MRNIFKKGLFVVLTLCNIQANATDIVWDFTNRTAQSLSNNSSYSFKATDGTTEMRYTAGSSDAIVAKSGNKDGYLKENGKTGSASAKDVDGTTPISKTRLIRLFVTGSGTLTISCNTDNIGVYKIYDGSASGTVLVASYTANTTSSSLTVSSSLLWIETTTKGYINSITWSPSGGGPTTPTVNSVTVAPTSVTLDPNDTQQLTATVDVTPSTADKSVSWTSSDANVASVSTSGLVTAIAQGTATITATSTLDNTKSGSCTVTVNAPATPIPVTAITLNKNATTIAVGGTETLTVSYTPADANTGKGITWSSSDQSKATIDNSGKVTGVAVGTATITATSEGGKTATCEVTVQAVAVTSVTLTPTTASVQVNGTTSLTATVLPANATNKNVSWSTSDANTVTVSGGTITGVAAGTAKVYVTTVDGGFKDSCTVAVTAGPPVPQTDLVLHVPEKYEAREVAGGYNTPLKVVGGREYEVYYTERTAEGDYPTFSTTLVSEGKTNGISGSTTTTKNVGRTGDTWFEGTINSHSECKKATSEAEFDFETKKIREHRLSSPNTYQFHVKGYDQFSLWGMDKKIDPKNGDQVFVVKIDGVTQTTTAYDVSKYTIRRYDMTTGEHLIEISVTSATGTNTCYMGGFSLRIAEEPRTKYLDGNDSTQVVYQTQAPAPVYYYTKYNSKGHTSLVWTGAEATGITLSTFKSDALGDTLELSGIADCAVGTYNYRVVSYNSSNQETSSVPGKIKVETLLRSTSRDTVFEAFTGEEMDQIAFSYYAKNPATDITLTWNGANPGSGVTGSVSNNKYVIHGIPSTAGNFKFTVSIAGGNSINGELIVTTIDMTDHPVMYLYKNSGSYENDGVYKYLTSGTPKIANLIPRKAQETGPRASYGYEWILISNDVDANNPEVIALIKDNVAHKPILNMQGFTYAADRLNWGEPNNGTMDTVSKNGCNIYIQQPEHPIFNNIVYTQGSGKLKVLNSADKKSVMPIDINNCPGSLCLATAYTRNRDDYYQDGELQTIIHEVPTKGSKPKYICFPLANTRDNLTNEGKLLLKNIVTYLTNSQSSVALPTLKMESFSVHGYEAVIDQNKDLITLELTEEQFVAADSLKAEKPVITVKDAKTHVNPSDSVDLRYTTFMPKTFIVTDYINRRAYSFKLTIKRTQGIEDVYEAGQWVNIFDIYGRKIATTNENIYTMELPRGIYIIVTENGGTIKIMK